MEDTTKRGPGRPTRERKTKTQLYVNTKHRAMIAELADFHELDQSVMWRRILTEAYERHTKAQQRKAVGYAASL